MATQESSAPADSSGKAEARAAALESLNEHSGFYMQTFGSFVQRFNLGGTVALHELNLREGKDAEGRELTHNIQRKGNIEKSRQAKAYFFTQQNKKRLEERMNELSPEEREELQTVSDADLISWFNRTKVEDEKKKTVKTIPGCFYKSRAQGAATVQDMDELNKFYKRSLVTCFLVLGHVYALVQFSYESRLLSKEKLPRLFGVVGAIAYPISIACLLPWLWYQNTQVIDRLDCKYTPIWLKISARQKVFMDRYGSDDDDEDDDDDDDDIPVGKNKTSLPESKKSQEQSVTQKKAMNK